MILANEIALRKKHISEGLNEKINSLLFSVLKSDYRQLLSLDDTLIISAMKQDKKRIGNNLPLIMLNQEFEFFKITDLTEQEATDAVEHFKKIYCN